ncbi:DNA primase subunit pri2 [Fusarium solani]
MSSTTARSSLLHHSTRISTILIASTFTRTLPRQTLRLSSLSNGLSTDFESSPSSKHARSVTSPPAETATHMKPILKKYLNLEANSSGSGKIFAQRQKDHYSHFILRLAFASTEDLRRRFTRVETMLFRLRLNDDDLAERSAFVKTLGLDWCEDVTEDERREYAAELAAFNSGRKGDAEDDSWFKVDWERVPRIDREPEGLFEGWQGIRARA